MKDKVLSLSDGKRSAIVFMLASILSQLTHMITTPIFTRILTVEEYGITTLFNSWLSVLGLLAMLSLASSVYNVGLNEYRNDRDGFTFNIMMVSNSATIIVMVPIILWCSFLGNFTQLSVNLLFLMFLYFLTVPAYNFWIGRQRYEYKYKGSAAVTVAATLLSAMLSIVWVLYIDANKAELKIWGAYIPYIILGLVLYGRILKKAHVINAEYCKFALKFNLPLLFHYLALNIMLASDRIMISSLVSEQKAGIYGLSYNVASVITIVWTAVHGAVTPYVFEKMNKNQDKDINKAIQRVLLLYLGACCVFMLFSPILIFIFATPAYQEGIYIIPIIVSSSFVQGIFYSYVNISFYYKKTVGIMVASVLAAAINVILNYFGIRFLGYQAAAYTTLLTNVVLCVFHYINMRHISGRKIFGIGPHIGMAFFSIVFSLLVQLFF